MCETGSQKSMMHDDLIGSISLRSVTQHSHVRNINRPNKLMTVRVGDGEIKNVTSFTTEHSDKLTRTAVVTSTSPGVESQLKMIRRWRTDEIRFTLRLCARPTSSID